jgi:amino acid adenylation domain-containing protein
MPTNDTLEQQRLALSASRRALLEKRLRGEEGRAFEIAPRSTLESAPTTFAQQRLWFLDQLEPGSTTYTIPIALRVRGPLCSDILARALGELTRRHETWRTTFESRDGVPVQRIHPPTPFPLETRDLGELPDEQREHEAIAAATAYAQLPFQLAEGPLVRALLLRLAETEHLLLLIQHHSISDGWSIGIILHELTLYYEALLTGRPAPLPPLRIQYADYACWQQQYLDGPQLERQLAYWRQQLADAPAPLDLCYLGAQTATGRPDGAPARGQTQYFRLPRALSDDLRTLCQHEGVTLFMLLLAGFQLLLHRSTGQEDLLISTSTANRQLPELEPIVGFFVNTLVLRTSLAGDPTFRELLTRTREVSLAAFAHQAVPFERALTRVPALPVHFILQNTPSPGRDLPGLSVERIELENPTAKFDLFLNIEDSDELAGFFEYNADLFDTPAITRLQTHFQQLLQDVVRAPDQRLSTFALCTRAERELILTSWSGMAGPPPSGACIHELFEAQVTWTADRIAMADGQGALTYQELNRRANRLARALHARGVAPEVPVGLYLERSFDLLVGVLAILKAGGVYVPLDPGSPPERLAWILADARAPVLLTHSALLPRLPTSSCIALCLDTPGVWAEAAESEETRADANPVHLATQANAAYIIYTSGSTGRPKGVLVSHRNVVNHSQAIARQYAIGSGDRVLQFASLSFDAAGEELYPTWFSGATLHLRPENLPASARAFHALVEQESLSILNLPTAYWQQWATQLADEDASLPVCLRLVIVGGEQVQAAHYRQWRAAAGTRVCWSNTYGPTEATITALLHTPGPDGVPGDIPPIGRPIANTQAYVLDRHLQPVAPGAVGELYLGGEGLARGYPGRADLTATRFPPNPYGQAGTRLYRTGDLARYLDDGNVVYIGRSDDQVKIRGHRIEPGEIASVLLTHPALAESVVLLRQDAVGDPCLVAYLVRKTPELSAGEIRQFLAARLPAYMLPARYLFLTSLPLTASGKVDRRALPLPDAGQEVRETRYVAPQTPVEDVLARVWADVLHITQIGTDDNFFEIGGHSLRATRLVARLQDIFSIDLPLKYIFSYPTIARLAQTLQQEHGQMLTTTAELFLMVADLPDDRVEALLQES